jgi:hypothetical protein
MIFFKSHDLSWLFHSESLIEKQLSTKILPASMDSWFAAGQETGQRRALIGECF